MNKSFALQLYSLREAAEQDFIGTLEKVATMGYKELEFAGYFGLSGQEMKEQLNRLGLKAISTHVNLHQLQHEFSQEIAFNQTIGNKNLICPSSQIKTKEDTLKLAELLNRIAEQCANEGCTFGYHNHAFEFEKTPEGETLMDVLIQNTSALVKLELDVYWLGFAGLDPVKFIQQHADRTELLHLKELSAERTNVELGKGILDFPAIIAAGEAAGVAHYIVEQEQYTMEPIQSVHCSLQYLQKL